MFLFYNDYCYSLKAETLGMFYYVGEYCMFAYFDMYDYGRLVEDPLGERLPLLLMKSFDALSFEEGGITTSLVGLKKPFFLFS